MISCICARSCQIHEVRERESRWSRSRVVPVRSHQAKLIAVPYPKPLGTFRERSASTVRLGGTRKLKVVREQIGERKKKKETQKEKARNTATPGGKRVCTFDLAGHALPFFFRDSLLASPLAPNYSLGEKKKGRSLRTRVFLSRLPHESAAAIIHHQVYKTCLVTSVLCRKTPRPFSPEIVRLAIARAIS